jgi:protein TonB
MSSPLSFVHPHRDLTRLTGLIMAGVAHFGIVMLLWSLAPVRTALTTSSPLMVAWIKPEVTAPLIPKPVPKVEKLPQPLPVKRVLTQPTAEQPVLAAQTTASMAVQTPPSEPKPATPVEALPAPAAPLTTLVPPNFNVDYLHNPAPVYPALSRRMGEEGRVLIRVFVEADGAPVKVELRTSSGSERLDQSALEAVRRWKFVAAKQGDKAIAAWVVVPVVFSLKG